MYQKSLLNSDLVVSQLIENLDSQLEMHEVLLEALQNEGQLPASCTLADLNDIQSVRDFAVSRIGELERHRLVLIDNYKRANKLQEAISLHEIIQQSGPVHQETLLSLRQKLLDVISEIKPVGRRNAEIAVARIACFNEVQGVLDKSFHRATTYSGKGMITKAKGSSRIKRSI
ncbi:MAG: flagellar protein FlgN [Proteobacteria bacterium]|nr:flagellar protein FlgN [Pseudomonadota bacterium]